MSDDAARLVLGLIFGVAIVVIVVANYFARRVDWSNLLERSPRPIQYGVALLLLLIAGALVLIRFGGTATGIREITR